MTWQLCGGPATIFRLGIRFSSQQRRQESTPAKHGPGSHAGHDMYVVSARLRRQGAMDPTNDGSKSRGSSNVAAPAAVS
jgi:hypothetical protein